MRAPTADRPRAVAITGMGVVSPIGRGLAEFWCSAMRGSSAIGPITRFDATPFESRIAGEVQDAHADCRDTVVDPSPNRAALLATIAAVQAIRDAGLERCSTMLRERAGVYLGSALGGVPSAELLVAGSERKWRDAASPTLARCILTNPASALAAVLGFGGPTLVSANSCASGAIAIGEAFRLVCAGATPLMLAGGAEAPLAPLTFGAFDRIRSLSRRNGEPARASRPFDRERDGFVMAEGAAVLVLEASEQARDRGARVYAEILGYGTTNDAYHMTAPHPDGAQARRSMELALADAGIPACEIGVVSAHASATPLGDRAEARALQALFGRTGPIVFATKGAHGHALGASPALETVLLALALDRGCAPPSTNLSHPDEGVDLAFSGPDPVPIRARYGLKSAFGFGGINAALVLGTAGSR